MKINLQKTVKITEEVNVELPHYRKSLCYYYKVYSDEKCISVCAAKGFESISITGITLAFTQDTTESNEEDFYKAFNDAYESLSQLQKNQ